MNRLELRFDRQEATTIVIDRGLLSREAEAAALAAAHPRIAVLFDPAVEAPARDLARRLGAVLCREIAGGEAAKTPETALRVASDLLAAGLDRSSLIVAVGGGVVCDLAGFVASLYMRGIAAALVPTSLLAMVDAAIGGKTAVDFDGVKNVLGSFHHPARVIVDPATLETLPEDPFRDGLVEVVKKALILDAGAWTWLERDLDRVLAREPAAVDRVVELAVALKAGVVREDPREQGRRKLLNFGHTVGHAVEAASEFAVSHGAAVAMGMVCEMRLASPMSPAGLEAVLERLDRPTVLPDHLDSDALWKIMLSDKKAHDGRVFVAVPTAPGEGRVAPVEASDFEAVCR